MHKGCGVAFRYDGKPKAGEGILARKATLLDGTRPEPYSHMRCGTCDSIVDPTQLSY